MKKFLSITVFAATMLAAITSCQKEELNNKNANSQNGGLVFYANLEENDATKTTIAGEGYKINWESTDEISVNGVRFTAFPDSSNPAYATFKKASNETKADPKPPFVAYYPASIYDGTTAILPSTQAYIAEGNIAFIVPMYARSAGLNLNFKNLCGLFKFTLKGSEKLQAITLADETKAMSGKFTVKSSAAVLDAEAEGNITLDCGSDGVQLNDAGKTFYVAVPAGNYDKLKVRYYTKDYAKECEMVANSTATIERNKVYAWEQTPTFIIRPCWPYFTAVKTGAKVALELNPDADSFAEPKLDYSTDHGQSWTPYTIGDKVPADGLDAGQKVFFKATAFNTAFAAEGANDYYHFTATDTVKVGGDIMYLLDGSNSASTISAPYCFKGLFAADIDNPDDKFLVSASDLKLPATTLSKECYKYMFGQCDELEDAPELPATTLATSCYNQMFNGCSSLTTAPELPATKLESRCYYRMFRNCTALVNVPDVLPATELADSCYRQMFLNDSSIVNAPKLPATVLKTGSYLEMFKRCKKLSSVTMLATDVSADYCLNNWLNGAGSLASDKLLTIASDVTEATCDKIVEKSPGWLLKKGSQILYPYRPYGYGIKIGDIVWAPVNCGYDDTHPYGLLYQWGREYGQEYEVGTIAPVAMEKSDDTEANEGKFGLNNVTDYNWYSGGVDNTLWEEDGEGTKEPCPEGWRVASEAELTALTSMSKSWTTTGGPDEDQTGYNFGSSAPYVFFPAAGTRNWTNGSVSGRNASGGYWTSTFSTDPISPNKARAWDFDSESDDCSDYYRVYGFSVRCVRGE